MQEIVLILSSLAGVATAAIARRIPKEKTKAGKTGLSSQIKTQITSLKVERDILNKIIARLYKANPDITDAQRDKLLSKYQYQLKIVSEKLDRAEQTRDHPDFNLVNDSLMALMDQKLSKLDDRLHEISAKMQMPKQELSKVRQDVAKPVEDGLGEQTQKATKTESIHEPLKKTRHLQKSEDKVKENARERAETPIVQKEPTPQSQISQTELEEPKIPSQAAVVPTATTTIAAATGVAVPPVWPKVSSQTKVVTDVPAAVTATTIAAAKPVLPKVSSQAKVVTDVPTTVTATKPVLPKVSSQAKATALPKITDKKKVTLPISESRHKNRISPIEKEIHEKIPKTKTEDKIQIIQAMASASSPENRIEKARDIIVMPKPATVLGPDKTETSPRPSFEQKPATADEEFDDDIQDLDEIKKDIAKIMTKLDQAEVE